MTITLLATVFSAPAARAADRVATQPVPPPVPAVDNWQFEVTPYIWITGMSGTISPFRRAPEVHIDESFSDILDSLNFAGFANAWGTNGTFGFYTDLLYVDTSEEQSSGPVRIPAYGVTVPAANVTVDSKLFMGALFGAFRLGEGNRFEIDALAGVRFAHIDTAVNASIPALQRKYRAASDFGWVDPAVGLRAAYDFGNRFSLVAQADIGGFSVGSDLTWQATGTINYAITETAALAVGYKYMSIDYNDDGHVFDTALQGPTVGLRLSF